jgi:hypothetical protein
LLDSGKLESTVTVCNTEIVPIALLFDVLLCDTKRNACIGQASHDPMLILTILPGIVILRGDRFWRGQTACPQQTP